MTQIKFWPGAAANFFLCTAKKSFFLPSKEESYNVYTLIGRVQIDLFSSYLFLVENLMSCTLTTTYSEDQPKRMESHFMKQKRGAFSQQNIPLKSAATPLTWKPPIQ